MGQSATLFANIAVLAALLSLGSYYGYQWLASVGWRSPLPWFLSGLAIALVLLSLGAAIVEFLPLPLLGPADSHVEHRVGILDRFYPRARDESSGRSQNNLATRFSPPRNTRERYASSRPVGERDSSARLSGATGSQKQSQAQGTEVATVSHQTWLEDLSFWGATECVLAIRLDPEDSATWTLINDCEVDVKILVATCASTLDQCREHGSQSWTYVPSGLSLPSKLKRSVSADEQTVHGLHLRYVACRLSGDASAAAQSERSGALRHIGMQSCEAEVNSLSQEGSRSGLQVEELVNEPVPANPCCSGSE
jgi:hypothetical protein